MFIIVDFIIKEMIQNIYGEKNVCDLFREFIMKMMDILDECLFVFYVSGDFYLWFWNDKNRLLFDKISSV